MGKLGVEMVRIALVEDDQGYADKLKEYLKRYEKESGQRLKVTYFADGEDIITGYSGDYDIILMDIEMEFLDGMTTAERIRQVDEEVVIIFITNMPQYVMKGYMVDALDYVLKPLSYFAFSQRIDRALSRMKRRRRKFVTISVKGGMKKLDLSLIYYIEVRDHDLIFHTADGDVSARGSMKDVEESLVGQVFFRCNKCYLINMEHVESFQNSDVVVGGDIVQVSRARKKEFMDRLNDYLNEVSK